MEGRGSQRKRPGRQSVNNRLLFGDWTRLVRESEPVNDLLTHSQEGSEGAVAWGLPLTPPHNTR